MVSCLGASQPLARHDGKHDQVVIRFLPRAGLVRGGDGHFPRPVSRELRDDDGDRVEHGFPIASRYRRRTTSACLVPNIFFAKPGDYVKAAQRVYHAAGAASAIELPVVKQPSAATQ